MKKAGKGISLWKNRYLFRLSIEKLRNNLAIYFLACLFILVLVIVSVEYLPDYLPFYTHFSRRIHMFPNRFSLICSLISGSIVAISIYMLEKFIKKAEIRELFDRAEHEGERNCKVVASFINDGIINLLNKKIKRDSDNYFTLLRCFEYVKMYMSFSVWDRVKVLDSLLLGSKQRARKEELKSEYEKYEEILDLARSFVLGLNILTPENPKEITTKLDANALRKHVESLQELRPKLFEKTMNSEDDLGM